MELREAIDPGICGYAVTVAARTDDGRNVTFAIDSECELMTRFNELIEEIAPVDAIASLSPSENCILERARGLLCKAGCCEACVVPVGVVKAMYVLTGLALPRDVSLKLTEG